jgi:hypothetical protein
LTPEEREGLRRHRVEVLAMLAPPEPAVELDRKAVAEVLGPDPDVHAVACLQFDVLAAVREIEAGVRAGVLAPRRLVHGRPLANWLPLDIVARLLRRGR